MDSTSTQIIATVMTGFQDLWNTIGPVTLVLVGGAMLTVFIFAVFYKSLFRWIKSWSGNSRY